MSAHKVDSEHSARYSDLLLAAWKLERWADVRDPLLLKTTTTGGLNITCSQKWGNLFPSWKLKDGHTLTAQQLQWKVTKLKKTQAWRLKRKKRLSVQLERTQKPQMGLGEQISQLGILSVLPMQSSCIRGKIKIVLDMVVLTISWKIAWRILARPPEKWV